MTDQPTTLTPLFAAAEVLREEFNRQFEAYKAERLPVLNRMTKDEVVTLSLEKFVDRPRSGYSKADAIEDVLGGEFDQTEIAVAWRKADREAGKESTVLRTLARREARTEWAQQDMAKTLASEYVRYNTDKILRAAFELQSAYLLRTWWDKVADWTTEETSPVEAAKKVRQMAVESLTNSYDTDITSRSTSLAANLTKDQERHAAVKFIEETAYLVRP